MLGYVLLSMLSGCGSASPRGPDAGDGTVSAMDFEEGTIIYREPVARRGTQEARYAPLAWVFTTAEKDLVPEDPGVQVFAGTVPDRAGAGGPASQDLRDSMVRNLFRKSRQDGSVKLLSHEQFTQLLGRLETAGLFAIPASRASRPPEDESYFQVNLDGRQWIITRPVLRRVHQDAPETRQRQYWQRAKTVLIAFDNEL